MVTWSSVPLVTLPMVSARRAPMLIVKTRHLKSTRLCTVVELEADSNWINKNFIGTNLQVIISLSHAANVNHTGESDHRQKFWHFTCKFHCRCSFAFFRYKYETGRWFGTGEHAIEKNLFLLETWNEIKQWGKWQEQDTSDYTVLKKVNIIRFIISLSPLKQAYAEIWNHQNGLGHCKHR